MTTASRVRFIVLAAGWCAITAPVVAAAVTTGYFLAVRSIDAREAPSVFLVIAVIAIVPGGGFGLIAGALGGAILLAVKQRLKQKQTVSFWGAGLGAGLGALFPVCSYGLHWSPSGQGNSVFKDLAFSIAIGAITGWLFGHTFASRLTRDSAN